MCLFVGWLVGWNSEPRLMPKGWHKDTGSRKCVQEVWRRKGRPKIWEKLICVNNELTSLYIFMSLSDDMGAKTQENPLEKTWKYRGKVKMEHFHIEAYKMIKF